MDALQKAERNKQVVRDFFETTFNKHDIMAGTARFRPDYIQHNPNTPPGLDGVREAFKRGIDNVSTSIKRMVAEGDLVVVHHNFKFDANGLGLAVMDIFRLDDEGYICEHWDVMTPVPENASNKNGMF